MEYVNDIDGKWELRKGKKYRLVEPSQTYIDANTPKQEELDNLADLETLKLITDTDTYLVRFMEDMVIAIDNNKEKFALLGIVLPLEILEVVQQRKLNRGKIRK